MHKLLKCNILFFLGFLHCILQVKLFCVQTYDFRQLFYYVFFFFFQTIKIQSEKSVGILNHVNVSRFFIIRCGKCAFAMPPRSTDSPKFLANSLFFCAESLKFLLREWRKEKNLISSYFYTGTDSNQDFGLR